MMERDYFMSADEAKKTGIVDKVVSERPDFEKNIKKKIIFWFGIKVAVDRINIIFLISYGRL